MSAFLYGANTLAHVRAALIKSGYSPEGILSAHFRGDSSSGSEIHLITFLDDDGKPDGGNVYIDANGNGDF